MAAAPSVSQSDSDTRAPLKFPRRGSSCVDHDCANRPLHPLETCQARNIRRPRTALARASSSRAGTIETTRSVSFAFAMSTAADATTATELDREKEQPSRVLRPSSAGSWSRSLSNAVVSHNLKAERAEHRIEQLQSRSKAPNSAVGNDVSLDTHDSSRACSVPGRLPSRASSGSSFDSILQDVEGRLAHLAHKPCRSCVSELRNAVSMSQLHAEETKRQERERHLRQQARAARSPQRRVRLKVQLKREAGNADFEKVPMRIYKSRYGYGTEHVSMVDVRSLQTNAVGLTAGAASFKAVCEAAHHQRNDNSCEHVKRKQDHVKLNRACTSDSMLNRTPAIMIAKLASQTQRCRQSQHKMHQMKALHSTTHGHSEKNPSRLSAGRRSPSQPGKRSIQQGRQPCKPMPQVTSLGADERISLQVHEIITIPRNPRWALLRASSRLCWLLCTVRRRQWAARAVLQTIHHAVYLKTAKERVSSLNRKVRLLQRVCRKFVSDKNRWCEQADKAWVHYEDLYLASFIKRKTEEDLHEHHETRGGYMSGLGVATPGRSATLAQPCSWVPPRVPPRLRKFALGRWYMLQMHKKALNRYFWCQSVTNLLAQQKDACNFSTFCNIAHNERKLNGCRHESIMAPSAKADVSKQSLDCALINQNDVLQLIVLCVQSLRHDADFKEHPANTDESRCRVHGPTKNDRQGWWQMKV